MEADSSMSTGRRAIRPAVLVLWIVALAALVATAAVALVLRDSAGPVRAVALDQPVPIIAEAPAFSLTRSNGEVVTQDQLLGQPWVASFIFTECRVVCPVMTMRKAQLAAALKSDPALRNVKLVSISVDPEHDTPEVLAAFAQRYQVDAQQWMFLTGASKQQVWSLVENGFKLPLEDTPENQAMPISHSSKFVLVDAAGQIRGYFSGVSDEGQAELLEALRQLQER